MVQSRNLWIMQEGVSAVQKFQRRIFSNTDTLQDRNQMWLQYHDNKILLSHLCLDPYISSKKYPKYQNSKLPWVNFGSTCIWNMLDSNNVETSDWHNFIGSWFSKHTFLMSFALTWSKYSLATNVELLQVIQTIVFNGVVGNDTSSQ